MLIEFQQGIYRQQDTRPFLTFASKGVRINVDDSPTIIAFAHGKSNYLFTEDRTVDPAWVGPFPRQKRAWLYWDIDPTTGRRTFNYTTVDPFTNKGFGAKLPQFPKRGQHFFLINENKMKYYTGRAWKTVIRVFAGVINDNSHLEIFENGSQVGKNIQSYAGHILFNEDGTPIKKSGKFSSTEFVTSETLFNPQNDLGNAYKVESTQINARAIEPVPKFHCVSFKGPKRYGLASRLDPDNPCVGIAVEDFVKDKIGKIVTHGIIQNRDFWNFSGPYGTMLWVGDTGEVTTVVPQSQSMQNIGYVINASTIFVDIRQPIQMIQADDDCVLPSPTPTPTLTSTPTLTPTPTASPALTLTPTLTPSVTPTLTITQTPTMTPSVTVSPTLTMTPTPTVTPSSTVIYPLHEWKLGEDFNNVLYDTGTAVTPANGGMEANIVSYDTGRRNASTFVQDANNSVTSAIIMTNGDASYTLDNPLDSATSVPMSLELWLFPLSSNDGYNSSSFNTSVLDPFMVSYSEENESILWLDNNSYESDPGTVPVNQWTHVVYTIEGTSPEVTLKIYINGVLHKTLENLSMASSFSITGFGSSGATTYNGMINNVKMYDQVLADAEISNLFASYAPRDRSYVQNNEKALAVPSSVIVDGKWLDASGQDTTTEDVFFIPDGSAFFLLGNTSNRVYRYNCSVSWDVSSAAYTGSFYTITQESSPTGFFFSPDGLNLYVTGTSTDRIYQYSLGSAWDLSTVSYTTKNILISSQDSNPHGLYFKSDGQTFYMVGTTNDSIFQYTCGTPWDLATASYTGNSLSVESNPEGVWFSDDGIYFYIVTNGDDIVGRYTCSIAWDITTGIYDGNPYWFGSLDSAPSGIALDPTGTKMYLTGAGDDAIRQFTLSTPWDTTSERGPIYEISDWGMTISSAGNRAAANGYNAIFDTLRVYVFNRVGSDWVLYATIEHPGHVPTSASWGEFLEFNDDETLLFAGSPEFNGANKFFVYEDQGGGVFSVLDEIDITHVLDYNEYTSDLDFYDMTVSDSGDVVAIGFKGATIIYRRSGNSWLHEQTIEFIKDSTFGFGYVSHLSPDGGRLVIGSFAGMANVAAAVQRPYVYKYNGGTTQWELENRIPVEQVMPGALTHDKFEGVIDGQYALVGGVSDPRDQSYTISTSYDGSIIIMEYFLWDSHRVEVLHDNSIMGTAIFTEVEGGGAWEFKQKLRTPMPILMYAPSADEHFSYHPCDISFDGNRIIMCDFNSGFTQKGPEGVIYVYDYNSELDKWIFVERILPTTTGYGSSFAAHIRLTGDGNLIVASHGFISSKPDYTYLGRDFGPHNDAVGALKVFDIGAPGTLPEKEFNIASLQNYDPEVDLPYTDKIEYAPNYTYFQNNQLGLVYACTHGSVSGDFDPSALSTAVRQWAYSTLSYRTGKYYAEFALRKHDASATAEARIGIINANGGGTSSTYFGQFAVHWAYSTKGFLWNAGASSASTAASDGDILQIAVDFDDAKLWFGINGTWIGGGDPELGTLPDFTLTDPTAVKCLAMGYFVGAGTNLPPTLLTARLNATEFTLTPPTGFSPWDDAVQTETYGYEALIEFDTPVHWWKFNSEVGNVVADEIGSEDLTLVGTGGAFPTINSAVGFKGSMNVEFDSYNEGYAELATQYPLTASDAFTIEAWAYIKPDPDPTYWGVIWSDVDGRGIMAFYHNGSGVNVDLHFFSNDGIAGGMDNYSTAKPLIGEWNHIVMVGYGDNTFTLYVNGVSGGTFTFDGTTTGPHGIKYIGDDGFGDVIHGYIDEFAIYNYAFTPVMVLQHKSAGKITRVHSLFYEP